MNGIYTEWLKVLNSKLYGWDPSTVIRGMLESASSNYVFNPDHKTVQEVLNAPQPFVELSAPGYNRATVTGKVVYHDTDTDKIQFRCDNISFGAIEAGYTVKGILLFVRTGSADNPVTDIPAVYIGSAVGLPVSTTGGQLILAVPVTGIIQAYFYAP